MTSSVLSRVGGLGVLTAAGQLLIIGTLPAYSNIFDPATYGEYVIFVGVFAVVSVIAGVRYDSAIVLPRNDGVAASLSVLVMSIALTVSGLIVAATALASVPGLAPKHWTAAASHFGYGLAAATAVGALQRCFLSWCVRSRRFLSIGLGQFVFCLASVVAQLSFARVMDQLPALIWGYVAALAAQTACVSNSVFRARWSAPRAQLIRGMRLAARKYRRFPTYMVGYALASSVRERLIQIALGIGAGAAVVGRFGLAYRVIFAPNSLVYSAVSPVFFSIASRGSRLAVGRFAAGLVEATFVILVVPYAAFAIEAPVLTDAVLSQRWHGTGPYLQALAGPALLLASTCWLDRAFDSFRRQRVAFSLELSFTVISVICVGLLSRSVDAVSVVWAFGTLALAYYWAYFFSTFVACGFSLADFRRACVTGLLSLGIALVFGVLTHQLPMLSLRLPVYAVAMAGVIAVWIRFRGGADILRMLLQSRIDGGST
ncbi:MAG: lipopolysaccharide biosynthesis protein [Steroidobacteraceae bacterium]